MATTTQFEILKSLGYIRSECDWGAAVWRHPKIQLSFEDDNTGHWSTVPELIQLIENSAFERGKEDVRKAMRAVAGIPEEILHPYRA